MLYRKESPPVRLGNNVPDIRPSVEHLENTLPVYYLKGGSEKMLKIEFVFFAGGYYELKPYIAQATANLLRSGTTAKSQNEINELFDYYSAHIHAEAQKDIMSVSMFVLTKHLEPAIKLFREILTEAVFPEDEMRVFLKNKKQLHAINQKKVQHLAMTYFNEMIYGETHPYGYRLKTEDFDKVERDDLKSFRDSWFHPRNAFCIVSGDLPERIAVLMAQEFGKWDPGSFETRKLPVYRMLSSGSRKMHLDMPNALQSAIRIGKQLVNRTHPAYHRIKITNALLGGFFGSRLMQNIRQNKGYTYGIGSSLVSLLRGGYFFISTQVGTEVCKPALEEIYKELQMLRSHPAGKRELETLKNYLSGSFLRAFDGPLAQAERLKELLVFGLDSSHLNDYANELKTISAEDIMETAATYLREDEMMEVVAGKQ